MQQEAIGIFHCRTFEDAREEVERRKASGEGASCVFKIIKSRYSGYQIYMIDAGLYAEMLTGDLAAPPALRSSLPDYAA